jgi:hypothetical protein
MAVCALALTTAMTAAGCGAAQPAADVRPETAPLPTAGLAGRKVTVYPLTLLASDDRLGWRDALTPHRGALARADSLIGAALTERSPEVEWVLPDVLRRAHRQAPAMLPEPDHIGTALLRARDLAKVPDPLRSQMRALTGVAGDRYALVPAALVFRHADGGGGRAELTLVLTDVRLGQVGWRNVAEGEGQDPWSALEAALKTLAPGLP